MFICEKCCQHILRVRGEILDFLNSPVHIDLYIEYLIDGICNMLRSDGPPVMSMIAKPWNLTVDSALRFELGLKSLLTVITGYFDKLGRLGELW